MIIHGNQRYIEAPFSSEQELEDVVTANFELIFGPDSIFLPKALIKSAEGVGTIPDGFAVDLGAKTWYVVEAELASHGTWRHIAPQVAKQVIAAEQPETRAKLREMVIRMVKSDEGVRERFADQGVAEIDIPRHIEGILSRPPVVAIPIDNVRRDLEEWANTLRSEVKLWKIRKLVEFRDERNVIYEIPDEFRPSLDTANESSSRQTSYDVSILDLVEAGRLNIGQDLTMTYSPRNGSSAVYRAVIQDDGSLLVDGKQFSSPSFAALYGIQAAGSSRATVNGWRVWKTDAGQSLFELRAAHLGES